MKLTDLKLIIKSFDYIKGYRVRLTVLMLLTVTEIIISLVNPILWGTLIQHIVSNDYERVLQVLSLLGGMYVMQAGISYFKTYVRSYVEENISLDIKRSMYKYVLDFSSSSLDQMHDGSVLSHLDGDTQLMGSIYTGAFLQSIIAVLKFIIISIIVCRISYIITLVVFFSFPISYGLLYVFGQKLKKKSEKSRGITDRYFSFVQESTTNIKEVKAQGIKDQNLLKFTTIASKLAEVDIEIGKVSALSNAFVIVIDFLSQMVIYTVGIYLMSQGELELRYFIAVASYAVMLSDALMEIAQLGPNIQGAVVAIKRINDFTNHKKEKFGDNKLKEYMQVNLKFDQVSFSYVGEPVVEQLSFAFTNNGKYAIVGESGSGKTTIMELILRLYEPNYGSILINHQRIESLTEEAIRQSISVVSQEPILFNDTILNNLTLGNEKITRDEVVELCEAVNLDAFIGDLPEGYETVLSESGKNLSVGQRQRFALVRALLRKTKIILLDEVMASQDSISREKLLLLVDQLSKKHMIVMVEHRLSNIIDSKKIIVIKEGVKVGEGNHVDLMDSCEHYKQLFKKENNQHIREAK